MLWECSIGWWIYMYTKKLILLENEGGYEVSIEEGEGRGGFGWWGQWGWSCWLWWLVEKSVVETNCCGA